MSPKFEQEKGRVVLLMRHLGLVPASFKDPQVGGHPREESGADVIVMIEGRRIGIQVTDIDPGDEPGRVRAIEATLARNAAERDSTYSMWIQSRPEKIIAAITRSIERKSRMSFAGFGEFWYFCVAAFRSGRRSRPRWL